MKYAIISNNKLIDCIEADESYYDRLVHIFDQYDVVPLEWNDIFQLASIGEYYNNGQYLRFMKIAQLTVEQYRSLFGQTVTGDKKFSLAVSPDGLLCVGEDDINNCTNPSFQWVKSLPLQDYTTSIPSVTPPAMTGVGVVLPPGYDTLGLFPNNQFNLNGFIVEFVELSDGQLAVDLGYLGWMEFRQEQDNGINATIKEQFSALWYTVLAKYQAGDTIQLP